MYTTLKHTGQSTSPSTIPFPKRRPSINAGSRPITVKVPHLPPAIFDVRPVNINRPTVTFLLSVGVVTVKLVITSGRCPKWADLMSPPMHAECSLSTLDTYLAAVRPFNVMINTLARRARRHYLFFRFSLITHEIWSYIFICLPPARPASPPTGTHGIPAPRPAKRLDRPVDHIQTTGPACYKPGTG